MINASNTKKRIIFHPQNLNLTYERKNVKHQKNLKAKNSFKQIFRRPMKRKQMKYSYQSITVSFLYAECNFFICQ